MTFCDLAGRSRSMTYKLKLLLWVENIHAKHEGPSPNIYWDIMYNAKSSK
jgi:hypothetical protein